MKTAIFIIALAADLAILLLSLIALVRKNFQFWPPSSTKSWQYYAFWGLFRVMFLGVIVLSVLDFNGLNGADLVWRYYVGIPLATAGFGLAFYITFYLGWKNAHGEKEELVTDGFYGWSRNPVYVVSIVGLIGLGLAIHSGLVYTLLAIWAFFYIIAPFLEEPWLEEQYGKEFLTYKMRVPRFIGLVYQVKNINDQ